MYLFVLSKDVAPPFTLSVVNPVMILQLSSERDSVSAFNNTLVMVSSEEWTADRVACMLDLLADHPDPANVS